jgi:ribosome-binding protein aMBF1 (putative translation factor)
MLETTKKPHIESVTLSVVCDKARLEKVKAALSKLECKVRLAKKAPTVKTVAPEKEWYSIEESFPDYHAGHRLRGARYREDISQRQLSKLTGVSVQNLSAMENGRRPIGKEMAKRLGETLNVDWRLLLS